MNNQKPTETVQDFINRGGHITRLAVGQSAKEPKQHQEVTVKSTTVKVPVLFSLEEGEHFFGDWKQTPEEKHQKQVKRRAKINTGLIPDELKNVLGLK